MDRGRKRPEPAVDLPADKRACSSTRPASPSSSSPNPEPIPVPVNAAVAMDCDVESTSSGRSDRSDHSTGYGSCDSDSDLAHPSRYGARTRKIFSNLTDEASPGAQLAALTELCELLSFCTEDSLAGFPLESAVPSLLKLASCESNPDIMLLAIRALTYLCDVMPSSADALVRHGTVPVLCGRLLAIEYLDVAEQCLQALEKISKTHPLPCLQAGTISAALTYIDFFSSSVQRVALSIVANVCKKLPLSSSSLVMESVPALCNLLQYEDRKLVETVATCLIRITECFSESSELLDELSSRGLIQKLLHLVAIDSRMSFSRTVHMGLIGLLTKLATRSLLAVRTLFEMNIGSILKGILLASDQSHGTPYSSLQDLQSNQVHEVLKLLNQLIPSASREVDIIPIVLAKEKILVDEPKFLHQFSADILPVAIQVVNSGTNIYVCYACVSVIQNVIYLSTSDVLLDLLKHINISSFLAGLLARKDQHVLFPTLKVVEILMQKLPEVFYSSFMKEGVIYLIDALLILDNSVIETHSQSLADHSNSAGNQMAARDASKCLCYAFSSCRPSLETKTCRLGKDVVRNLAEHIKVSYFSNTALDSATGLTEILRKLQSYCGTLNENGDKCLMNDFSEKEDYLSDILGQVLRELNNGDTMSTFEFIESGIVKSLAQYMSNGRYLQGTPDCDNSSNHCLSVLTRFQTFAAISLGNSGLNWEDMLLTSVVRKLQSALSSLDNFPVILSHFSKQQRNVLVDIPVRHSTMHPCLRICFLKEEGEESIKDYNEAINVELSTTVDVIEGYLWPKVRESKNQNQAEPAEKDIDEPVIIASKRKGAEGLPHQEVDVKAMRDSRESTLTEVLNSQERQTLLVDTSTRLSELMNGDHASEKYSESSSSGGGQAEDKISSSSSNDNTHPKLVFSFKGKQLDPSITLYQAILQSHINADPDIIVGPKFWNEVYKVTYKKAKPLKGCAQVSSDDPELSLFWAKIGYPWHKLSFFSSLLCAKLPCRLDRSNPSYDVLFLMKVLEGLNRNSFQLLSIDRSIAFIQGRLQNIDDLKVLVSMIPQTEFINSKLTDKLEQQMRDSLVLTTGSMPLWCSELMAACPFLFSFETRWKYFRMTTVSGNERRSPTGIPYREKFRVDRSNILESAAKMMDSHARSRALIEVEYNEEVGTGLGPTMEFYTLVSHEFQKIGMGMWREDRSSFNSGGSEFVVTPNGLFPCPASEEISNSSMIQFADLIKKFFLLGKLVAKAIKDGRMLDISFSKAFYKVILEQELGIYDIQSFDPELGRTLLEFQALVNKKRYLESISGEPLGDSFDLSFRNTRVEDLCLDFTLPGYPDYGLTGGSNKLVNVDNLEEYVTSVVSATISDGISRQVEAFKSGFNEVFPLRALHIFTEDELDRLLCGERDTWDFSQLHDHLKFDHGYTASSTSITNLLEIIEEFGCHERRAFLQFATGAPRLPPGGLAALKPKMTVVRKHCGDNPDMDLPSVMTCANYLKLPSYSSKERMRERLLYAITEGQGSFHLS